MKTNDVPADLKRRYMRARLRGYAHLRTGGRTEFGREDGFVRVRPSDPKFLAAVAEEAGLYWKYAKIFEKGEGKQHGDDQG